LRLNTQSTTIQLKAVKESITIAESSSLLVINLKDIKTDRPLRRERHIKEAQQNASKKWTMPIANWSLAMNQMAILFEGRMLIPGMAENSITHNIEERPVK